MTLIEFSGPAATHALASNPAATVFPQSNLAAGPIALFSDCILIGDAPFNGWPIVCLAIGIICVLGMIIGLRINAFLSLIVSALVVSILGAATDDNLLAGFSGAQVKAVTSSFGGTAGGVGIAIAMAAIIGKCMLDSGAADRIVRSTVAVTGESRAAVGLMFSGFLLSVPVFFDTVFYLLVPLARGLFRRTNRNYLRYLMAIATGGAITHTLVPPTPGPLMVGLQLNVDVGMMMMMGTLVGIPTAIVGLLFSVTVDRYMPVPMRPLGSGEERHQAMDEEKLPSLFISLLPVILPVVLIGTGQVVKTLADREDRARMTVNDITDFAVFTTELQNAETALSDDSASPTVFTQILTSPSLLETDRQFLLATPESDEQKNKTIQILNEILRSDTRFYDAKAFLGVEPVRSKNLLGQNQDRMGPTDRRRLNRSLLEDAQPDLIVPHEWVSNTRWLANLLAFPSNASVALMLAAAIAMLTLKITRSLTLTELGKDVEECLLSAGMIILITAAGGAFGAMLSGAGINEAIKAWFLGSGAGGIGLLLLAYSIAAVLKVAQGSSTVAMIVGSGIVHAIVRDMDLSYHPVYLATAVGCGSLMGSWMNDSGFWVFAKMGGLTEAETLRSWTPLLAVLSVTSIVITILLSVLLPLA